MTIQISRWLTLAGFLGLIISIYVWHVLVGETPNHAISILLIIQIGPLMFPLRGLLQGKVYTHAWSMYVAIFYFVIGVWYSSVTESLYFGLLVVVLSLTFFTGTLFYTRLSSNKKID